MGHIFRKMALLHTAIALFVLSSCTSSTLLTGTWKNTKLTTRNYDPILVAALTSHAVARSTVEDAVVHSLSRYGVNASRSIDVFPPKAGRSDTDETAIMRKVLGKNMDAILTISLLRKGTETRYIPGGVVYDPFRFDYYRNFWGYYSWSYDRYYDPGYFTEDTVYYIETNLYEMKTMQLVWSAQSRTYQGVDLGTFADDLARTLVKELKKEGLIPDEKKRKK